MRVLIVGAGIGGLAAALALRQAGIDVLVLEQAEKLEEVGAGIQLSPNGVRILARLGVEERLAAVSVEPQAHLFRDWRSGETLLRLPLCPNVREAFGAPYYHAHRADLLAVLLERLGTEDLRLGSRVVAIRQNGSQVEAKIEGGGTTIGDVLVGADGIHSMVRDQVFAPDPPRPSGYSAWRGLVPIERAAPLGVERYSYIWLGPSRSMVLYQISGGKQVNWVGLGPSPEAERESWSATGSMAAALREYDGWHEQITGLIRATETLFLTKLFDRHPLPSWVRGRIVLLGDAAHAMLPYHAQGAVQSLEDAAVLAGCLARAGDDVEAALARYEGLRRDRATQVQAHSRNAQDWYHYTDDADIARRNARFRRQSERGGDAFSSQQEWLYAYDADQAVAGEDEAWRRTRWS